MLALFLFLLGLFFGSFFLVLIDRLPRGESPLGGRSHCESCKHVLAWYDLIPLFSFLLLRGRCRYCHKKLSYYYPFLELLTGVLFALTPFFLFGTMSFFLNTQEFIPLIFSLFVVAIFIIIFFIDLRDGIIPFIIVLPTTGIAALYILLRSPPEIFNHLLSALIAGVFFFLLFYFTNGRGMGFGDVVLVVYLGLLLGFPGIVSALYLAFLTGAAVSLILILSGKKKLRGGTVPFGPFLIFGAYVSFFWNTQLIAFITSFLLR